MPNGPSRTLADLFRVLMADNLALNPLSKEIDIARQYLAIEELRLGERLRVAWRLEGMPADALVPALLLQPLVENAVYHGIEPIAAGGEIAIAVQAKGGELVIRLSNPIRSSGDHHTQAKRWRSPTSAERLQLHFEPPRRAWQSRIDGTALRSDLPAALHHAPRLTLADGPGSPACSSPDDERPRHAPGFATSSTTAPPRLPAHHRSDERRKKGRAMVARYRQPRSKVAHHRRCSTSPARNGRHGSRRGHLGRPGAPAGGSSSPPPSTRTRSRFRG